MVSERATGCLPLTGIKAAPAGAPIALERQGDRLVAVYVDRYGTLQMLSADGNGPWTGPLPLSPPEAARPGTAVALGHQGEEQLDAVFIGNDGAVYVAWTTGEYPWQGPVGLTEKDVARPKASVALHRRTEDQLDAVFISKKGALMVLSAVVGVGGWQGPVAITGDGTAPPLAPVILDDQGGQLDAFFADGNGVLNVMWPGPDGVWLGPVPVS